MADNEKLNQFISITGVDGDRARFFLESSAWQLEAAIASFYENDGPLDEPSSIDVGNDSSETVRQEPPTHSSEMAASSSVASPKQSKGAGSKPNSKFATIHTINNGSSDEDEEGQAFYAGGSEHSGQQVLGPKKDDIIKSMVKAVREKGVEIAEPSSGTTSYAFRGTGYKLGQTSTDSETIAGAPEQAGTETCTLRLWRNGFSIDDGELRVYSSPTNKEFLQKLIRGEMPPELRKTNNEIHLAVEDHHEEDYKPLPSSLRAFTGHGYTLGSPTPAVVGAPAVQEQDCRANEARAKEALEVDQSQPTTNIQIRLADGSRLVARFNQEHTVAQVRSYILTARPQYETRPFTLLSTYPSRELTDTETLKGAGLLNAAIMQKLI